MRAQGWEERLLLVIEKHQAQRFSWGGSNCMSLVFDAAEAIVLESPEIWRGTHVTTRTGAHRRLKQLGFASLEEALASLYPEIPPSMAQRGDIGIVISDEGPAAVLFMDAGVIGKGKTGMTRLPRSVVKRAFRVG